MSARKSHVELMFGFRIRFIILSTKRWGPKVQAWRHWGTQQASWASGVKSWKKGGDPGGSSKGSKGIAYLCDVMVSPDSWVYSGPLDCVARIHAHHGLRGLYHGLSATLLFRGFFFFWWSSYDVLSRALRRHTDLPAPAVNFWAGGLSAQVFWLTSYPSDLVKQRIMTDPLGAGLGDGVRRFPRWRDAAAAVYAESGWRGYWRGFLPCFLRAFPANAVALVAFEAVVRALP
ncbi:Mitochondrial carrier domain protein [Ophiocordyceps sinensis CO18]|uniref:Mitochondrial carrier domain protein n=1 Tax=Ophiocordyceps sinensis (strain Co18 / CGMCC 3.14243) TaxID=911162 RepID=T5ADS8_OPHSC|nr:Mitochondrial carrier domain protein [Ophiocordyceps sinensis CO18]